MRCRWCNGWEGVKPVLVEGRVTMTLCFRCFGILKETGQRPPAYRMSNADEANWKRLERIIR